VHNAGGHAEGRRSITNHPNGTLISPSSRRRQPLTTLIGGTSTDGTVVIGAPNASTWTNPTGTYPALVKVGSEVMEVTGGAGTAILSVNRGALGTAAAAHASGATLSDVTVTVA
jgi:hypothetical protein